MVRCREQFEQYLRDNGVRFEVQHHPTAFTAQEVAASEHISGKRVAKVVIVVADGKLVMLALPAALRVDLDKCAQALGAHEVRLAEESEFADRFGDCDVGAMPPFGGLYGLPLYMDRALANELIIVQAGTHSHTASMQFADYERLAKPKVADFAAHEAGVTAS